MLKGEQIRPIPLDDLIPSPGNRRIGGFNLEKLKQLADSIQAVGVQQPIVVRPNGQSKFEIVAGERRWKAARIAGLLDIPAVVRDLDDVTVLKIQTIENLQREDIHPLDEADGYARLIEQAGYDVEHLAREVGRSASYVYQRLKLRDLVDSARKMLADSKITAGHAILIARLPAEQQKELLGSWLFRREEDISVRELDGWIHNHVLLDLNKAAFKKDDPGLDPTAGPCTTCPKRTGYQPALFADVCNGGKRDYCTDPPCFNGKLEVLIQRRRIEFKESDEAHLEVIDGYQVDYQEEQRLKKAGIKERYAWEECKKKDEGAVRCLVVAGTGRGRITWGRERKQMRYEPSPKEKKSRQKEKRDRQIKLAVREGTWDAVMDRFETNFVFESELPAELLLLVARKMWDRIWDNSRKLYCKTVGWEATRENGNLYGTPWHGTGNVRINGMTVPELRRFLVTAALVEELDQPTYNDSDFDDLKALAAQYKVDVKAIDAQVKLEFAEKEAQTKKKAKAKKAGASAK